MIRQKVALVTGGARGIGLAAALALAREGVDVAFCDLAPADSVQPVIGRIAAFGRRAIYFPVSVTDRDGVEQMVAQTAARLGSVDILVNNAGLNIRKPLLELEPEDVQKVWDTVVWGTFHCTQFAARQMVTQGCGGSVVMISSVHASRPYPRSSSYNGAKAAINQMAATWAAELAVHRIRVNAIEPGWTDTPGERAFMSDEEIYAKARDLPFGRLASPDEIANAVCFLALDEASYVTGACLRVDGGIVLPQ